MNDKTKTGHVPQSTIPNYSVVFVLILVLTFGLFLRYKAANHPYISQWDEAYHALVAKNFLSHPLIPTLYEDDPLGKADYKLWKTTHIWLNKPPGATWIMSLAMAIGGQAEIVFRWPSVLLGTLAIWLTFLIGKELFGCLAGMIAAGLHAINPLFLRLISGTIPTDHVDLLFGFFIELSILSAVIAAKKRRMIWVVATGMLLGCAVLIKSLPALVVLGTLPLFWRGKKEIKEFVKTGAVILIVAAVIVLPWKIYTTLSWPQESAWESHTIIQHFRVAMEGHDHPANWYMELIPVYYGGMLQNPWMRQLTCIVVWLAMAYAVLSAIRRRDEKLLSIILWAVIPYTIFSLAKTKLVAYAGIGIPAVLLLMGYTYAQLISVERNPFAKKNVVLSWMVAVVSLGLLLANVIPTTIDRVSAKYAVPWSVLYDYPSFKQMMSLIGKRPGKKVILNVGDDKEIQAMYYADCPVYPGLPSVEEVLSLMKKGYTPYIVQDYRGRNRDKMDELFEHRNVFTGEVMLISIPGPKTALALRPYVE